MEIDRAALLESFLAECEENLQALEQGLLRLEVEPHDEETVHALFRAAHTIKGNAGIVDFEEVAEWAHTVEEQLDRLRKRTIPASPAVISALLASVDALKELIGIAAGTTATRAANAIGEVARREPWLRIASSKLDAMLTAIGEITVERLRVEEMLRRLGVEGAAVLDAHRDADRLYVELQQLVLRARMVRFSESVRPLLRSVRDIAGALDKQVRLITSGDDVEVDTRILERLREPLVHLVRNAIDHGIEAPVARESAGKDRVGTLKLTAVHASGELVLSLEDDGAGLDREKILARARERGIVPSSARLTPAQIDDLVFAPGLTTTENVSAVSGRGVGMDAVRRATEEIGGSVIIESERGVGTKVVLRVPLTVAILDGLATAVGDDVFVVPLSSVTECIDVHPSSATSDRSTSVVPLRDEVVPCMHLAVAFDVARASVGRGAAVIVQHGGKRFGLVVDRLIGKTQVVVRPLSRLFHGVRGLAASAVWNDGRVALVLDVPSLIQSAAAA